MANIKKSEIQNRNISKRVLTTPSVKSNAVSLFLFSWIIRLLRIRQCIPSKILQHTFDKSEMKEDRNSQSSLISLSDMMSCENSSNCELFTNLKQNNEKLAIICETIRYNAIQNDNGRKSKIHSKIVKINRRLQYLLKLSLDMWYTINVQLSLILHT